MHSAWHVWFTWPFARNLGLDVAKTLVVTWTITTLAGLFPSLPTNDEYYRSGWVYLDPKLLAPVALTILALDAKELGRTISNWQGNPAPTDIPEDINLAGATFSVYYAMVMLTVLSLSFEHILGDSFESCAVGAILAAIPSCYCLLRAPSLAAAKLLGRTAVEEETVWRWLLAHCWSLGFIIALVLAFPKSPIIEAAGPTLAFPFLFIACCNRHTRWSKIEKRRTRT